METNEENLDRLINKAMDAAEAPTSDFAFTKNVMSAIQAEQPTKVSAQPIISTKFKIGIAVFAVLIVAASMFNWSVDNFTFLNRIQVPDLSVNLPDWSIPNIWLYGLVAFFFGFVAFLINFKHKTSF